MRWELLIAAPLLLYAGSILAKPFGIQVIDEQTGRGVPLVELKTTSHVRFYTDSAGWAAIDDPAMLGHQVYFDVTSDGYEMPADGLGSHGVALNVADGGEATIKIKRLNIAERLYRLTGEGIYRDSVLLGKSVPIAQPLLNAQVTGQDSVQCAVYRDKIWWFFGDTLRQSYKLGQYSTSGATSELPSHGGLDPSVGINLDYFTDAKGFSRPMVPTEKNEADWLDGLTVLPDQAGRERMMGVVTRVEHLGKDKGRYLAVFDEGKAMFQPLMEWNLKTHLRLYGHPFHHTVGGVDYLYCGDALATIRVRADWKSVIDPTAYEAFIEQPHGGTWQRGAEPPTDKAAFLHDATTGKPLRIGGSSIAWNEHRKKWAAIIVETGGSSSFLGEVWYGESDQPEGPWSGAIKIVTHDHYSFYNPTQHPFFAQPGGRYIYFQGTYSATFSRDEKFATPRYDYTQIMYRLNVEDARLEVRDQGR
jgi:hypothetical protein